MYFDDIAVVDLLVFLPNRFADLPSLLSDMRVSGVNSGGITTPESQQYGTGLQHTLSAAPTTSTTPVSSENLHNPFANQTFPTQGKTGYLTMSHALNHSVNDPPCVVTESYKKTLCIDQTMVVALKYCKLFHKHPHYANVLFF